MINDYGDRNEILASQFKNRKGRKKCGSSKRHGMQTMNSKVRETASHKPSEEIDHHAAEEKITWNLDEEIIKIIETGAALGAHFSGTDIEVEIAKAIETGVALGFDFNGHEKEMAKIIARREEEDEAQLKVFRELIVLFLFLCFVFWFPFILC